MCWHRWSKWQIAEEGDIKSVETGKLVGWSIMQKRSCAKCGKAEMDVQRRYGV